MSPLAVGAIGFVIMLVLKGLRSPIGVGLGLVGFFGVWYLKGFDTALCVVATAPVETPSGSRWPCLRCSSSWALWP